MKTIALFLGCGIATFAAMGFHMGVFRPPAPEDEAEAQASALEKKKPALPATKFPQDLAPACQGRPVPQAAGYNPGSRTHPMAFLTASGKLHRDWQEHLKPEWQAESVESTELVVVVGADIKTHLSTQTYANNAPPVHRFKYELDAWLMDAKTGKVLARNRFVSNPRQIRKLEDWALTAIGQPVSFTTVYNWAASQALAGFGRPAAKLPKS